MSETKDASSSAAQRAQPDGIKKPLGLLTRLLSRTPKKDMYDLKQSELAPPASGLKILKDLRVDDVAVPRADITAVSDALKLDELLKVFKDSGFSRLPVYHEALDTPQGLLHLKDLALKHGFNGKGTRFSLKRLLRPLLYVPPSMPIGVLLQTMQSERIHMGLVIDEYGGVDGLVTIEDLIEQVVGEIEDEHDTEEETYWTEEKPGVYICQSRAPLDEFEKVIGAHLTTGLEDEDIETLGGLVFMMTGRVPVRGEVIKHPAGFEFEVADADPRRIKKLRIRKSKPS